jgi:hypothetical protein
MIVNNEAEKIGISRRSDSHPINQQAEMRSIKQIFAYHQEDRFYSVQGHFVGQAPVADTTAHNLQI